MGALLPAYYRKEMLFNPSRICVPEELPLFCHADKIEGNHWAILKISVEQSTLALNPLIIHTGKAKVHAAALSKGSA